MILDTPWSKIMLFLHELDDFFEALVLEDVHLIEQLLLPIPVVHHPALPSPTYRWYLSPPVFVNATSSTGRSHGLLGLSVEQKTYG